MGHGEGRSSWAGPGWIAAAIVVAVLGGACGDEEPAPFGMRYELSAAPSFQTTLEIHWGPATASEWRPTNRVAVERRFHDRAAALAVEDPVRIVVAGEAVFSESPRFTACDFVAGTGLDPMLIRVARFSRSLGSDGRTVSSSTYANTPDLLCYTEPRIVTSGAPASPGGLEALLPLSLPAGTFAFAIDGGPVVPLALGRDEESTTITALVLARAARGATSFGAITVTVDGNTTAPLEIPTSICSPAMGQAALSQVTQPLRYEAGQLSIERTDPIWCCYENGACAGIVRD